MTSHVISHIISTKNEQFGTTGSPNEIVKHFNATRSLEFCKLDKLRSLGWKSTKGDEHFQKQRSSADRADSSVKRIFFHMMCQIGLELHNRTSAFTPKSAANKAMQVLDICMAPGGFSSAVLKVHCNAQISAITLPKSLNGHDILLHGWRMDKRVQVHFADVTMLAAEMYALPVPPNHPDALNFRFDRPYMDQKFDLIFCDGQVLRMHQRADYREKREASRLLTSQLVVALQRITQDGTVVVLLHRLDAWDTIALLYTLSTFSTLELFKPEKKHAIKSSFYVVAKDVQSHCAALKIAVDGWKQEWRIATFGTDMEYSENRRRHDGTVWDVLGSFGDRLVSLAEPVWRIQSNALLHAPFMKHALSVTKVTDEK